jgi:hypothetical protein
LRRTADGFSRAAKKIPSMTLTVLMALTPWKAVL